MSEQPLWAPWRSEYVTGPRGEGCVLCAAADADDVDAGIVERGERCFSLLNAYPYTAGHVMVVPYRHIADIEELTEDETMEIMRMTRRVIGALRRQMNPDGFNVGMNLGPAAGAGIAEHLHLHVVPRWNGDTNFMSVLADTRVISEALQTTRDKLAEDLT